MMRHHFAIHALISLLVAALFLAVGLLGVWAYAADRRSKAEAAGMIVAEATADAAAQRVESMLEWVRTLHALGISFWRIRDAGGVPESEPIAEHLRDVVASSRLAVLQVAIIDATGRLAWSTTEGWTPVDLADRQHFAVHAAGRVEPFVSAPLVGRASGRTSIQVTRPILHDGTFAGVVVVSLDPSLLSRDVSGPPLDGSGLTTLFRGDGVVLATSAEGRFGPDCTAISPELLAKANAKPRGSGRMCPGFTGEALVAWRAIPAHPLHVAAAMPLPEIHADLPRTTFTLILAVVAASLALGAAAMVALTLLARRRDRRDAARAEAARRETTRLLEAMPGAVYRGVATLEGNYTRLYLSPELSRITGFDEAAVRRPEDVWALMDPEVAADRAAFMARVLRTGEQTQEYRLRASGDRWVWVRERCRLVRWISYGVGEVAGLLTDITAEREMQAKAMGTNRLATLGEMAAGIAHELNQPAASIAMAADVAMLELDAGDAARRASVRRRLDDIAGQIIRMRNIVDHLRTFSRPDETGPEHVRVDAVIEGALALATGTLHAAGVTVMVSVAPGLPLVQGRLTALEQVLVNLMGNARDAMAETPPRDRHLDIEAWHDAPARQVAIRVRDRGHGLPPGVAERVFEPFFTTKPLGEGTGLGLSIAYGTVRSFGGTIAITNREGGGAEVMIRLPEAII